jgi:hypothetical protein
VPAKRLRPSEQRTLASTSMQTLSFRPIPPPLIQHSLWPELDVLVGRIPIAAAIRRSMPVRQSRNETNPRMGNESYAHQAAQ